MTVSVLDTVKIGLGLEVDYTPFDGEILIHINSVFGTLNDLGIGPEEGFRIEDSSAVWSDFNSEIRLDPLKTYMILRVKLLFDTPNNSFVINAMRDQIKELEWRLNARREEIVYPEGEL